MKRLATTLRTTRSFASVPTTPRIAICGAGVSGLTLAGILSNSTRDVQLTVFERARRDRDQGYGLDLDEHGQEALVRAGVYDRYWDISYPYSDTAVGYQFKATGLLGSDKRVDDARQGKNYYNLNEDQDIAAGSQDRASVVNLAVALVSGLYDQQYAAGIKESVQIGVWLHFTCNYNPKGKVKGARVVYDRAGVDQKDTDFLF